MKLVLDTNSLLLLVVGTASEKYIPLHKRTNRFSSANFYLLNEIVQAFDSTFTIPQVLTETSNLLRNRSAPSGKMAEDIWGVFENFVLQTEEMYKNSASFVSDDAFLRLGLTDAYLALLSDKDHEVLTCDAGLYYEIRGRNHLAINFNHEIEKSME